MRRNIFLTITISQVFIEQSFARYLVSKPTSLRKPKVTKDEMYFVNTTDPSIKFSAQNTEHDNNTLIMGITSQPFNLSLNDNEDNRNLVEERIRNKSRRHVSEATTDVNRHREHKKFNKDADVASHFMEVWVGTPAQRMSMRISTTSPYTIMGCGSSGTVQNPMFSNDDSQSFKESNCDECSEQVSMTRCRGLGHCEINGSYLRLPWTAYEARDVIRIGGPQSDIAFESSFACEIKDKKLPTLSIMSMTSHTSSFNNQMYNAGKIPTPDFSLCFAPPGEDNKSGLITLGGYNSKIMTSPMVYAKNIKRKDAPYSFYIKNIYLRQGGGTSIVPLASYQPVTKIPFNRTIFNEGYGVELDVETPYTVLHRSIEQSFKDTWKEVTGMEYVYSTMYLTDEDALIMPTILIQLQAPDPSFDESNEISVGMTGIALDDESPYDVLLAIPPTQYLQRLSSGLYRTRISLKNKDGSVLGANTMNGRLVHFDNSKVGFAEVQSCNPSPSTKQSLVPTPIPTKINLPTPNDATITDEISTTLDKISISHSNDNNEQKSPSPTYRPTSSNVAVTASPTRNKDKRQIIYTIKPTAKIKPIDTKHPTQYSSMGFLQLYYYCTGFIFFLGVILALLNTYNKVDMRKMSTSSFSL